MTDEKFVFISAFWMFDWETYHSWTVQSLCRLETYRNRTHGRTEKNSRVIPFLSRMFAFRLTTSDSFPLNFHRCRGKVLLFRSRYGYPCGTIHVQRCVLWRRDTITNCNVYSIPLQHFISNIEDKIYNFLKV